MRDSSAIVLTVLCLGTLTVSGIGGCMYGWPKYQVYSSEQAGKAELAQADYSKQVQVQQSKAKADAATYEANAEIIRARGVASANKIIADGLGGPEGYLRYLYIDMLRDNGSKESSQQIIYVPTEGNLPILEAGKRPTLAPKD